MRVKFQFLPELLPTGTSCDVAKHYVNQKENLFHLQIILLFVVMIICCNMYLRFPIFPIIRSVSSIYKLSDPLSILFGANREVAYIHKIERFPLLPPTTTLPQIYSSCIHLCFIISVGEFTSSSCSRVLNSSRRIRPRQFTSIFRGKVEFSRYYEIFVNAKLDIQMFS